MTTTRYSDDGPMGTGTTTEHPRPTVRPGSSRTARLTGGVGETLAMEAALALGGPEHRRSEPDQRPVHTQGIFATGTFVASTGAPRRTSAAHLQPGARTSVQARFSNSTPGPRDDLIRTARGLAVRFLTPGGGTTDLVTMNADRFFAADQTGFATLAHALAGDQLTLPARLARLVAAGKVRSHVVGPLATLWPPTSYARCTYFGVNTFRWHTGPGAGTGTTAVRYRWFPAAGAERSMPRPFDRARWQGRHVGPLPGRNHAFLLDELHRRFDAAPVAFHLDVQYGDGVAGPLLTDPTRLWDVPWHRMGTMTLDRLVQDRDEVAALDAEVYSPLHLCPGISAHPGDEILRLRGLAYPPSHANRTKARKRLDA